MSSFRLWIAVTVILAATAGLTGGVAVERYRCGPGMGDQRGPREPHMLRELNLTDEQRAKILPIWEDAMRNGPKPPSPDTIFDAQQELETKLNALLTDDQKKAYATYKAEYQAKLDALRKGLDEVFAPAEKKTRDLLTPEQQKKFDEIMTRMRSSPPPAFGGGPGSRGPGGGRDHGPGGPGDHGPDDHGGPGGPPPDDR